MDTGEGLHQPFVRFFSNWDMKLKLTLVTANL